MQDLPAAWQKAYERAYNRLQSTSVKILLATYFGGLGDNLPIATLRERLMPLKVRLGNRLWLAPSCSLLHVPVDVNAETDLGADLKSWLAFARQKLDETVTLSRLLDQRATDADEQRLVDATQAFDARRDSTRTHQPAVATRLAATTAG